MSPQVVLGGTREGDLIATIEAHLLESRPNAIGIASAYVSLGGVDRMLSLLPRCGSPTCRLVAGIDHAVTHPAALYTARDAGWDVRLGKSSLGGFHPKLIVGGDRFDARRGVASPCFASVGSANLTDSGLTRNTECVAIAREGHLVETAAAAFSAIWRQAKRATDRALERYSAHFSAHARAEAPAALESLGIGDSRHVVEASPTALLSRNPPARTAVAAHHAEVAWTGLQSFTGEYAFQIEFPRVAGQVIERLVRSRALPDDYIKVLCSDGTFRQMKFAFYAQNGMFRLNVPNDVPGVQWARQHREGLAVVRRRPRGKAPISLDLHRPGAESNHIVARSFLLGTWGNTSTRLYGWF